MRTRARPNAGDSGPDLIPIMNLTTMLIPLLLLGGTLAHISVIDSTLPAIGPISPCAGSCGETPLNLSVSITDRGFYLSSDDTRLAPADDDADGERPPTVPCKSGAACAGIEAYDFEALTQALSLVKDEHPDELALILIPESRVAYEVIIGAMDAARADSMERELFSQVVIAGGKF